MTSGFRRGINEICALLGFYAEYNVSLLPTFRANLSVPSSRDCLTLEDMRFAAYMAVLFITFFPYSFGSILYHCIYSYMFCMLLFNFVQVSLMYTYCYMCSVLCTLFHCVVLFIVCVQMCTVLLPLGVNPIAVNKYIIYYKVVPKRQQVTTFLS